MDYGTLCLILISLSAVAGDTELIEVDFDFPEGSICANAAHILTYSIPISCNAALERVMLAGLPLNLVSTPSDIDLGDLCQTYCTAPMRQVGEDCSDLKDMYRSITAACDTNENGTRCYDLRESTWPLWTNCSGNTSLPCTQDCANAMLVATDDMGCCFNSLLNGSQYDYSPFNGGDIWDHCGVPIPEGPCSTAVQIQTDMLLVLILICCIILTS